MNITVLKHVNNNYQNYKNIRTVEISQTVLYSFCHICKFDFWTKKCANLPM